MNKYLRGVELIKNGDGMHYIINGQGDVSMLLNSDGNAVASYAFDAYGNQLSGGTVENPFGYRGEYADAESGLIYLRARMYDPVTGRFLTEDPAHDGDNWYVYCSNNPIVFVDPSGMIKEGDNKLNDCIQVILNGPNKDGQGGLSLTWKLASKSDKSVIADMAEKIRSFNTENINRHMILVQTTAAAGAGHTATLLLNKSEQGLLFSFFPENGKAADIGQMRIAFLNVQQWDGVLYNQSTTHLVASNGTIQYESFNGNLYLEVESYNGKKALNEIAYQYTHPGEYSLISRNCDHMTSTVATAAGIFYDKRIMPNDSFVYTSMYHTNYKAWFLDQMLKRSAHR